MAKPQAGIQYRDVRGGLSTGYSDVLLSPHELRRIINGRVVDGRVVKRNGSRRIHDTALFTANGTRKVQGGIQFQPTGSARQIVAVAEGDLRHKVNTAVDFTNVGGVPFSTTDPARFSAARVGGNLLLFVAAGALRTWSGAAIATPTAAPANAVDCALYKGRMWVAVRDSMRLYGSRVSPNCNDFTVATGGLEVDIETYDNESIIGLVTCGHSLIIAKDDSLSRLTGVSSATIQVEKETEGLSSEVGCIARATLIPVLDHFFFVSEHGPYLGSESGVESLSLKVRGIFDGFDRDMWRYAVATHNVGRHEIVLTVWKPELTSAGDTQQIHFWTYDYHNKTWSGPFTRGFGGMISAMWSYERPGGGRKTFMSGGLTGFVCDEDVPNWYKDDTARLGVDGNGISVLAQLPALQHEDGTRVLNLRNIVQHLEASLVVGYPLTHQWRSELGTGTTQINSSGYGRVDYPFKSDAKGARIYHWLVDSGDQYCEIGSLTMRYAIGAHRQSRSAPSAGFGADAPLEGAVLYLQTSGGSSISLAAGEQRQLTPVAFDGAFAETLMSGLVWASSDATKVAVTQVGVIRHVAAGSANITVTGPFGFVAVWVVTAL